MSTAARISSSGTPSSRIVGLDALRALLLSYGILVHTSNVKIESIFFFIEDSSSLFRMNAFFFISGLLTALTIGRLPPRRWLHDRMRALGAPLLFGLLALNPLFFLLQEAVPKTAFMIGFVERNRFDWHLHLWFLFSLIFFTVVAYAIRGWRLKKGTDRAPERTDLIAASPQPNATALLLVLVFPFAHFGMTFVMRKLPYAAVGLEPIAFIAYATIAALPFYLLGFLMPAHAGLRALFSSRIYWLVGLLSIPLLADITGLVQLEGRAQTIAGGIGRPAFALAFILMTTPWFIGMKRVPRALQMLSESSYTMYIVHLLLISIFLYAFAWLGFGIYPAAIATAILTFGMAIALHYGLVQRSAWLRFLLNGRSLSAGRPRP